MLQGKVDLQGLEPVPVIEDVQSLNEKASLGMLDVTKMSFAAYRDLHHSYLLLDSGSALGMKCGPLVIAKRAVGPQEIVNCSVAIPGANTTAHFLFEKFYPGNARKRQMVFSEIEHAVLSGETDLGVIIHENRFTYAQKGLRLVSDLGLLWEQETSLPLPLGGIFAKKSFSETETKCIESVIRASVIYARQHPDEVMDFVRHYSQEMDEEVMRQHIELYVNDFTVSLGETGRAAVDSFLQT